MKFRVAHGHFKWNGKQVKEGDVVEDNSRLDQRFRNKFVLLPEAETLVGSRGPKQPEPPSDGGSSSAVLPPAGAAVTEDVTKEFITSIPKTKKHVAVYLDKSNGVYLIDVDGEEQPPIGTKAGVRQFLAKIGA